MIYLTNTPLCEEHRNISESSYSPIVDLDCFHEDREYPPKPHCFVCHSSYGRCVTAEYRTLPPISMAIRTRPNCGICGEAPWTDIHQYLLHPDLHEYEFSKPQICVEGYHAPSHWYNMRDRGIHGIVKVYVCSLCGEDTDLIPDD